MKIPVIVYCIAENEYYEFESVFQAAKYFNLDTSSIFRVLSGKLKQTNGYSICELCDNFEEVIQEKLNTPCNRGEVNRKQVKATDTYGNSEIYDSCIEAAKYLGVSKGTVSLCCKGLREHSSFKFEFFKENK